MLSAYLKRYGLMQLIDTATHFGDALAFVVEQKSVHATSIEFDEVWYRAAKQRLARYPYRDRLIEAAQRKTLITSWC